MKHEWLAVLLSSATLCIGAESPVLDIRGWTLDQHVEHSLVVLSEVAGVTPEVFRDFFEAIKVDSDTYLKAVSKARGRLWEGDEIADTLDARDEMLQRMAEGGYAGFDEALFKELFHQKQLKLRKPNDPEAQRTVTLLSWLEDLVREGIFLAGQARGEKVPTQWYLPGRREFGQDAVSLREFPFEDGDILIAMSSASLSSMIGMSTRPQRRMSHAMLIRKREGRRMVLEAFLVGGVVRAKLSTILDRRYNSYAVLRLRPDLENRDQIIALASDKAFSALGQPYDAGMTSDPSKGFYCSLLVAWSYAEAASEVLGRPVQLQEILPQVGRIMSPAMKKFMSRSGVEADSFVAPGDFLASPYGELVADFRMTDQLLPFWAQLLTSHVYIERLEGGWQPHSSSARRLFRFITWWDRRVGNIAAIPDGMTTRNLSTFYDYDVNVYRPVLAATLQHFKQTGQPMQLRTTAPWEIRGALSYYMDTLDRPRNVLRAPYDTD